MVGGYLRQNAAVITGHQGSDYRYATAFANKACLRFYFASPLVAQKVGIQINGQGKPLALLAELRIAVEASRLLSYRVVWMQSRQLIPNHEASMSKAFGSELGQRISNFGIKMLGLNGQRIDAADPGAPLGGEMARSYMRTSLIP